MNKPSHGLRLIALCSAIAFTLPAFAQGKSVGNPGGGPGGGGPGGGPGGGSPGGGTGSPPSMPSAPSSPAPAPSGGAGGSGGSGQNTGSAPSAPSGNTGVAPTVPTVPSGLPALSLPSADQFRSYQRPAEGTNDNCADKDSAACKKAKVGQ